MSTIRLGRSPSIPFGSMKVGRPVLAQHGLALAQATNELATNGRTVFFNPCRQTLSASGGTVTSGLFRHKVPLTRYGLYRVWVICYSTETSTIGGYLRINPTIAPTAGTDLGEASHSEWATGKYVEPFLVGGSRRFHSTLYFIEKTNEASYTLPSASHDLSYTLTWTLTTSSATDILIRHVACYELDSPAIDIDGGEGGIDLSYFRPFAAIFSRTNEGPESGWEAFGREADRLKADHTRRWLWGMSYPNTALFTATNSATFTRLFATGVDPRVHPPRYGRATAGFKYAPVKVRIYGQNSAVKSGSILVKSAYDSTGIEVGYDQDVGVDGWSSAGTINCYCESTIQDLAGTQTEHGFQKGLSAGADTVAETDRSSALDDRLIITGRSKIDAGDAANTFTVKAIQAVYEG